MSSASEGEIRRSTARRAPDTSARAGPRRADGAGSPMLQRRERGVRAVAPEAQQQLVRVGQYAPFRPRTTGIVRARIVRSSQIDHVSM